MVLIRRMPIAHHATQASLITGLQWKPLSAVRATVDYPAHGLQNILNLLRLPVCSAIAIRSLLA